MMKLAMADGIYRCQGSWESCTQSGTDQVDVAQLTEACNALYKKTAADLVQRVDCRQLKSDGSLGPVVLYQDRCN